MDLLSRERANTESARFADGKWKPGCASPNPSGRPKSKPITDLCAEIINDPSTREQIKQQVISTLTSRGMAGVLLLRELAERVEGKITQGIELSGSIATMSDEQVDERLTKLLDLNSERHDVIDVQPTQSSTHEPERDSIPAK
jgi:hypothetical protein